MARYHINSKGEPGKCRAFIVGCPFGGDSEHHSTPEKAREAFEKSMAEANTPAPLKKTEPERPAFEYTEEAVDRDEMGNVVTLDFEHRLFEMILTKNDDNTFTAHQDYVGSNMSEYTFAYDGDPKDAESIGSYAIAAFNGEPILPEPSSKAKMSKATKMAINMEAYGPEDTDHNGNVIKHAFEQGESDLVFIKSAGNSFTLYNDFIGNPKGQSSFTYDGNPKDTEAIKAAAISSLSERE